MSFWDRYLAPGDLRARRLALAPPPPLATEEQLQRAAIRPSTTSAAVERVDPARRARRQNALFFGGIAFTMLSAWVTRRSLIRKRPPVPTTFTPSNAPLPKGEGGLDAIEALGLATINTVSVFATAIGAGFIYWDIADIEDLRDKVRKGVGEEGRIRQSQGRDRGQADGAGAEGAGKAGGAGHAWCAEEVVMYSVRRRCKM
jgi:hypothetical protein